MSFEAWLEQLSIKISYKYRMELEDHEDYENLELQNMYDDGVKIEEALELISEKIDNCDYAEFGYDECDNDFADKCGVSALRAVSYNNPRNVTCPTCGCPNRLTPKDKKLGYQCDKCAERAESGQDGY